MISDIIPQLLDIYGSIMILKLFIDSNDEELKIKYNEAMNNHNNKIMNSMDIIDAGFDIYVPNDGIIVNSVINKLDFSIKCSASIIYSPEKSYKSGFYIYPRSSISKTPLRLANNVGIIDAGYRGNLIGMFDSLENNYEIKKFDRYLQICAPSLIPILIDVVDNLEELGIETIRGSGGFGSTGR